MPITSVITAPPVISVPWGANAASTFITNPVPKLDVTASNPGGGSYQTGIPPLVFTDIRLGGKPLDGKSLNGVLYALSAHAQNRAAGFLPKFVQEFSEDVGGYPKGARIASDDNTKVFRSLIANNTTNPNTSPTSIGVQWEIAESQGNMISGNAYTSAVPSVFNFYIETSGREQYHTVANATANWSLNVQWNAGLGLGSVMTDNNSTITIIHGVKTGGTAFQLSSLSIDSGAVAIFWRNKTAAVAPANALCYYKFKITKITGGFFVLGEMDYYG